MFESHENIVVSVAILCQAICVCDIMNKASFGGWNAYITPWAEPFSALHGWIASNPGCFWRTQVRIKKRKKKVRVGGYWCKTYWQNNRTKPARENIITFSKFSGPFASSFAVPFKACHRENLAWNVNSNNLTVTVPCTVSKYLLLLTMTDYSVF